MRTKLAVLLLVATAACGEGPLSGSGARLGAVINAPEGQWTWVPVKGAVCGNGSPTGFAVNLAHDSNRLLVFYEGGGACRNYVECFVLKSAVNIWTGYDESTFASERADVDYTWFVTQRNDPNNPFYRANIAYVPYCTGDLHGGHNVVTYAKAKTPVYHMGGANSELYLQRLGATLPDVKSVWLSGFSAGGFATLLNRAPAAEAFPDATINILDDSGLAFADAPAIPRLWDIPAEPDDCDNCDRNLSEVLVYDAQKYKDARVGLLTYQRDSVLPLFFYMTENKFSGDIRAFTQRLDGLGLSNLNYFVVPGRNHVTLSDASQTSQGFSMATWIKQLVEGSPDWRSYKPDGF